MRSVTVLSILLGGTTGIRRTRVSSTVLQQSPAPKTLACNVQELATPLGLYLPRLSCGMSACALFSNGASH